MPFSSINRLNVTMGLAIYKIQTEIGENVVDSKFHTMGTAAGGDIYRNSVVSTLENMAGYQGNSVSTQPDLVNMDSTVLSGLQNYAISTASAKPYDLQPSTAMQYRLDKTNPLSNLMYD
jgi:hypothetical protein